MTKHQRNLIRSASIAARGVNGGGSNAPKEYSSRRYQYLGNESSAFIGQYAKYASDFFESEAQGLDPSDPYTWRKVLIRMADVVSPTAFMTRKIDNYKIILVEDGRIDYIRQGTKFRAMGSVWLCIDPQNISGAFGSCIVERCNAVWNHLDHYGNLLSEPLAVDGFLAKANASDPQGTMLVTKDYFNVKCQYNHWTAQLNTNSRMILGSAAYAITGYSDFSQEFTGDYDSVRMIEFTIRYEEPNFEVDDMERHVAGGKNFLWEIAVHGEASISVGETVQFQAESWRNGEPADGDPMHPVSYLWYSDAPEIAKADAAGMVTAIAPGMCKILCVLGQNQTIQKEYSVTVTAQGEEADFMAFDPAPPEALHAYESVEIACHVRENGAAATDGIVWSFAGASKASFSAVVSRDSVLLSCWSGDDIPLVVTVEHNGQSVSAVVRLLGI